MVEKAVNIEAKGSLQPLSKTGEIDFRCPKSYRPLAKKDRDKVTWEYQDGDKTKSHNSSLANTSQPQTQASKKDKWQQENH